MCGNRVEELEDRVQELEASVEGLTDELVECKVRIRELENTVDDENGFSESEPEQTADTTADAEPAETAETAEAAEEASESADGEIIVPEAGTSNTEGPEGSDKTADPEAEAESDSEDDSGSDIIVA